MGTLSLDEGRVLQGVDGKAFAVAAVTTTSDIASAEHGSVWCYVTEKGTGKAEYELVVCTADWTEQWYTRWLDAFLAIPEYREQFRKSGPDEAPLHPAVRLELPSGVHADVDELLAPAVAKLNAMGSITTFCCQGVPSSDGVILPEGDACAAYILLDEKGAAIPLDLFKCWQRAGFSTHAFAVHVDAPFGLEREASALFVKSLEDWVNDTLDSSGERYKLTTPRRNSLPMVPNLPQKALESKQQKAIKALIRKGAKARFRDFAELKSGSDRWSKMRLPNLIKELGGQYEDVAASNLEDEQKAKVARWVLRGLPVDMAIRKVRTDLEISQNAR